MTYEEKIKFVESVSCFHGEHYHDLEKILKFAAFCDELKIGWQQALALYSNAVESVGPKKMQGVGE